MKANKFVLLMPILLTSTLVACGGGNNNNSSEDDKEKLVELVVDIRQTETTFMIEDPYKRPFVLAKYSTGRVKNVSKEVDLSGQNMNEAGEQVVTISYEDLTTTYSINVCDNEFDYFCGKIAKFQGHVKTKKFTVTRTNGYLTTGKDFFEITLKDEGATTRYTRGDSYILNTTGTASYIEDNGEIGDHSKYQTQVYDDGAYFYKITAYPSIEWENSYKKIEYTQGAVELNYDVGFANSDIVNVQIMKNSLNDIEYGVQTTNFECEMDENDIWHYGYVYTKYEIDVGGVRVPVSEVSYDTYLTIKDGYGTHLEQTYVYKEYYGGIAVQQTTAVNVVDYINDDYTEYTGKILDYIELN